GVVDSLQTAGKKMITACMNGAPLFSPGFGNVWAPSTFNPYPLRWFSEFDSGKQIRVGDFADGGRSITVSWGDYVSKAAPPSRKLFFYSSQSGSAAVGVLGADSAVQTLKS